MNESESEGKSETLFLIFTASQYKSSKSDFPSKQSESDQCKHTFKTSRVLEKNGTFK